MMENQFKTEVLVASIRHPLHVLDSAKLGDKIKAAELLENALKLDPSFDKAKLLEEKLLK